MKQKNNYCGIDVSNETLDLYFKNKEGNQQHLQVANSSSGFRKMLKESGKQTPFCDGSYRRIPSEPDFLSATTEGSVQQENQCPMQRAF